MKRYYRFGGVTIALSMPEEWFFDEEYRLEPFGAEPSENMWLFRFEKTDVMPPPRGKLVHTKPNLQIYATDEGSIRYRGYCLDCWEDGEMRAEIQDKTVTVHLKQEIFPGKVSAKYVLDILSAEHLIARSDGFVLHCSYVDCDGKAILFTAPSETGKSTQADLWHQYRGAEIINGDRAAIRLENGVLLAEGIPYAGSSQYCKNRTLPVLAVVYLGQAPRTTIRKMRGYEAFARIWEGISVNTWDKEDMERISAVVQKAAAEIPVYHLCCTPDESAVIALEDELRKLVK